MRWVRTMVAMLGLLGCRGGGDPPLASAAQGSSSARAMPNTSTSASAGDETDGPELPEEPKGSRPIVDLGGVATLPPPIPAGASRVAAVEWLVRVHARPSRQAKTIGYLRGGAVVQARAERAAAGGGCKGGWQGVEPAGLVCLDDMTRDLEHPVVKAAARRADPTERLPYMYGTVTRGGPAYARIPSDEHLKRYEPNLRRHLDKWRADDVSGAAYGLDVWLRNTKRKVPDALAALADRVTDPDIPAFLQGGAVAPNLSGLLKDKDPVKIDQVDRRQGRSFIYSFLHQGRRYNVTPDLVVVPADRFRPIRGSSFHGYRVDKLQQDKTLDFPFALVRRRQARKWLWDGKRMKDGGAADYRAPVKLTGKQRFFDQRLHYETVDGYYLDDRTASRVDPAKRWPKWAQDGAKWIDVNITKQVLVAYEGTKMVFATLISSGEAGLGNHETSTATRRGIFRVHTKWVSVTMASDVVGEAFELRDVPYVQYFKDGYALHGAYWHDSFGRPKSHGCINLSPEDARRLFFWTDPPIPPGWHGALRSLTGTIVFIHA